MAERFVRLAMPALRKHPFRTLRCVSDQSIAITLYTTLGRVENIEKMLFQACLTSAPWVMGHHQASGLVFVTFHVHLIRTNHKCK